MKLYLAGNTGGGDVGKYRELMIKKLGAYRLYSFFWVSKEGIFFKTFFNFWSFIVFFHVFFMSNFNLWSIMIFSHVFSVFLLLFFCFHYNIKCGLPGID